METKKRRVRRTPESYRKEVSELTDGAYEAVGDFKGTRVLSEMKHLECGHIWRVRPSNFIDAGSRCPLCAGKPINEAGNSECLVLGRGVAKSNEEFLNEVHSCVADKYTFLEDYKGSKTKISIRHNEGCGYVYKVTPNKFLSSGSRCPKCFGRRKSHSEFLAELHDAYGDEYTVLSKNVKSDSKIKVRHNKGCGEIFYPITRYLLKGKWGCPKCAGINRGVIHKKRALQKFNENVLKIAGEGYVFLDEYVGSQVKMRILHTECGNVFETTQNKFFIQGSRCPHCVYSRGEKAVADVLDSLSIEYTREHSFEDLGRKRFDFFIPSLNIAIEYDGEQHYKSIDAWGGEEYLESVRQSDALKNDFCDYLGIDLLRIPYWEFDNIHEIVTNFIDTVKLMRSISASGSEMSKCR